MRRRMDQDVAASGTGLIAAALVAVCSTSAFAQQPPPDLSPPTRAEIEATLSTNEVETRLVFLEQRLEAAQFEGRLWYYGWLGLYGAGITYNSTRAALTGDNDTRLASLVTVGKSMVGVTQMLLEPLPARLGADPIRAMPAATPEQVRARLNAAESLLLESAERAGRKYTWWPHISNALLNLAGGGIILAFGEWQDAAVQTGLGLAFGEARIWTVPNRPLADLAAYEARYGRVPEADTGWYLVPRVNGAALVLRF